MGEVSSDGIRNEDVTELSFSDESFDLILSFDVFEHVFEYKKGFLKCFNALRHGGRMIITAPFCNVKRTQIRAVIENGEIRHLLEPEYHGNPLSEDGCLCVQHFGWDILDDLKQVGFTKCNIITLWSKDYGYMGLGEQFYIVADK